MSFPAVDPVCLSIKTDFYRGLLHAPPRVWLTLPLVAATIIIIIPSPIAGAVSLGILARRSAAISTGSRCPGVVIVASTGIVGGPVLARSARAIVAVVALEKRSSAPGQSRRTAEASSLTHTIVTSARG